MQPRASSQDIQNINLKIGLSFFVLLSVLITGLLFTGSITYKKIILDSESKLTHDLTKVLGTSINRISFSGKYHAQLFSEQLIEANPNILYIMIFDSKGLPISNVSNPLVPKSFTEARAKEISTLELENSTFGSEFYQCCDSVSLKQVTVPYVGSFDREVKGKIAVGILRSHTERSLLESNILISIFGILLIFLSSILVTIISNKISEPVKQMALMFQSILNYVPISIVIRNRTGNVFESSQEFRERFADNNENASLNMFDVLREKNELIEIDEKLTPKNSVAQRELKLTDKVKTNYYNIINFLINGSQATKETDLICTLALNVDGQKNIENELRQLSETASRAAQAKTNFLATMSHEMRTPLTTIIGYLSLIKDEPNKEKKEMYLAIVEKASDNLLILINDILDYSRIESGEVNLSEEKFNLSNLIREVSNIFSLAAKEKKLSLISKIDSQISEHYIGDAGRIRQIIVNIVGNALKFTHAGSIQISIESIKNENDIDWIRFGVKDTGIGMTKEQIDRIFEMFFQADATASRKFGGAGLGLSISRHLAKLLGGDLKAESQPGSGSFFYFEIPLERVVPTSQEAQAATDSARGITTVKDGSPPQRIASKSGELLAGKRILVVDDDEANRFLVETFLTSTKLNVDYAKNGREALELFNLNKYDVILMDIQMPEMDGMEATKEIRSFESKHGLTRVSIVAFTANVFKEQLDTYLDVGFNDHIIKPFKKEEFLNSLAKNIQS